MNNRKRIDAYMDSYNNPPRRVCNESEVRELEDDLKFVLDTVDLMIKDRDAFHDRNVELEKMLEITVEALTYIARSLEDFDMHNKAVKTLSKLKGESNES